MSGSDIVNKFSRFVSNLRTVNDDDVVQRRQRATSRLNQDFWQSASPTNHCRYIGSYGRGTEIRGASDVDLLFELPDSVYTQYNRHLGNGQSALLQAVRNSIRTTYSSTDVGGDGKVVIVRFADGMKFEIVPGFSRSDRSYTYPDSNEGGNWKKIDPVPEIEALDNRNWWYNKKVKHLCRMTRAWKKKNGVAMSGLLIDTFAYNFMSNWTHHDKDFLYYDFMTRDFLKYLYDQDSDRQYWHAPGSNQRVYRSGPFEYRAGQGYQAARKAIEYENNDNQYSANLKWKEIFGHPFPA